MAAGVVAGGFAAAKALFSYNKKNFMLDRSLKQDRVYQEQKMKIEQFSLYREDVRDLVDLTTSKMDLYMVVGALLVDKTMMMICKENDALPPGSPEWAVALNSLSVATAVFYFLLCLWLAMYASVSAQSFGTRLLTQFVRLPVASAEQIHLASAQAIDYESANLSEILRIPIMMAQRGDPTDQDASNRAMPIWLENQQAEAGNAARAVTNDASGADTQAGGAAASSSAPSSGAQVDEDNDPNGTNILPTAMLNHIRLYRRVQLNWQAFDAYARVSLFVGTNSLLYACLYWSLGQLLQNQHAMVPALGVSCIFATVQMLISRLDLRLRRKEVAFIGLLLAATPTITTMGILVHQDVVRRQREHLHVLFWRKLVVGLLAVLAHALHAVVMFLILAAAWPDETSADSEDAALLPGKFRSTLYLDVFGWLMNPGGPGATETGRESRGDLRDDDSVMSGSDSPPSPGSPQRSPSPTPGVRSSTDSSRRTRIASAMRQLPGHTRREHIGLSDDLAADASRMFSTSSLDAPTSPGLPRPRGAEASETFGGEPPGMSGMSRVGSIDDRWGGREAASFDVMERVNRANRTNVTSFAPAPMRPPRLASRKASVPGEIPWRAFAQGTLMVTALWTVSTLWALSHILTGRGWKADQSLEESNRAEDVHPTWLATRRALELPDGTLPKLRAACAERRGPLILRQTHAGAAEIVMPLFNVSRINVSDRSCDLQRPVLDMSLTCPGSSLAAGNCVALLLRRGGRAISACRLLSHKGRHTLVQLRSLRLAPGVPGLSRLAAVYRPQAQPGRSSRHALGELQIFARTVTGALVGFRTSADAISVALAPTELDSSFAVHRWHVRPEFEIAPAVTSSMSCATESSFDDSEQLLADGVSLLSLGPRSRSSACRDALASCGTRADQDNRLVLRTWDISTGEQTAHSLQEWHQWAWDPAVVLRTLCSPWASIPSR